MKRWIISVTLAGCLILTSDPPLSATGNAVYWVDRGLKISETKPNSDEEAACYRKALEIDPNHAGAHFNLAYVLDYQARRNWRGAETAWDDVGCIHEAAGHYAETARLDVEREDAFINLAQVVDLLISTPSRRPPDLYRLRDYLRIAQEAGKQASASKSVDYSRSIDPIVTKIEKRIAELVSANVPGGVVKAEEISQNLGKSFTRGQSPYQGPRVPLMIHFDTGKSSISPKSAAQLKEMGKALDAEGLGDAVILIEGHADSRGDMDFNQRLSEQRAHSVKEYLVSRFNLNSERFSIKGYGETRPIRPNETADDLAMNRRVEFVNGNALKSFSDEVRSRSRRGDVDVYDVLY
jgi:outer membrane protein OmpA-like peptidoglycan-associated protein